MSLIGRRLVATLGCDLYRALGAICLAAGLTCAAHAGELSLLINGKALHWNVPAGHDYNEENWGVGVHYEFGDSRADWVPFANVSEFLDSNDNVSFYVGAGVLRRFKARQEEGGLRFDLGVIGFLMHREGFRKGALFPGVLPVVSLGNDRFAVNMTFVPKVDPKMSPLLFFQLKIGLPWLR